MLDRQPKHTVYVGLVAVMGALALIAGVLMWMGIEGSDAKSAFTSGAATSACERLLNEVPGVVVRSGKPTLAAAHRVSGLEMAGFNERFAATAGIDVESEWRKAPSAEVDMCVFDGDFETLTPGPPGTDKSASRVMVIIEGPDFRYLSAKTRQKNRIPLERPTAPTQ